MMNFLKWYYTDLLIDDHLSWTSLLNLFPKTMVLLAASLLAFIIVVGGTTELIGSIKNKLKKQIKRVGEH